MTPSTESWRLLSLASESVRRTLASPIRLVLLVIASSAMFSAVFLAEILVLEELEDFKREEVWQGRGIVVVDNVPGDELHLLRSTCTQMSSHRGVARVGGLRLPQVFSLAAYPGVAVRLAHLDGDAWRMWFPSSVVPMRGIAVGSELANRAGVIVGDSVRFDDFPGSTLMVDQVIDERRPFAQAEGWLVVPAAIDDPIDQCWIEFSETIHRDHLEHVSATFANLSEYELRPVIRSTDLTRKPSDEFHARWTKWGSPCAFLWVALMYLLVVQNRKGEQAVYVTLGLSRVEDYLMSIVEVAMAVVAPGLVVTALVLHVHSTLGHADAPLVHRLVIDSQLLLLGVTLVLLPLVSVLRRRTSILDDLKMQ